MRLIGPDSVDKDEVERFTLRSSVDAVRCDDGATIVDAEGTALASYDGPCYVVVDGDERQLVTTYVFDAVFTPDSGDSSPAAVNPTEPAAQQAPSAPADTQATSSSSFDETQASHADPTAEAATSTTEPTVGDGVYTPNPATEPNTPPTQTAAPAEGDGSSATSSSDAGSSDTPTTSQDATAQSSGQ